MLWHVIPPFLTSVKTSELICYSSCRGGIPPIASVDEYYYRLIATALLIIVHVQCLQTNLVQATRAVRLNRSI
jgi:hypothetical protein